MRILKPGCNYVARVNQERRAGGEDLRDLTKKCLPQLDKRPADRLVLRVVCRVVLEDLQRKNEQFNRQVSC